MNDKNMWMIFVPTMSNEGKPYRTRYHRVWDEKVKKITGGLTITPPVHGVWISNAGEEYRERMIPVQILATREEMEKICYITKEYYNQLAVLAYKISTDVIYID